jgi:4-amino-4-deoxy-L-arabinose transferase-like glycosyltransferase
MGFGRPPDGTTPWADQNFFENLAWTFSQGSGFLTPEGTPTSFQAPGFPILLGLLYRLFGRHYELNSLLQSTLGACACLWTGLLARRIGLRPLIALAAAAIAAVLPTALVAVSSFTSEAPAQFFISLMSLLIAIALGAQDRRRGYRLLLLAGLVCGYGALVRPQMLAVPLFLGIGLVLSRLRPFWTSVWWGVSFGLAAAVVIAPWTIRNWVVLGGFAPVATSGGQTYLSANNPYTLDPKDERFGYTELGGIVDSARHRVTLREPNELQRDQLDYQLGRQFRAESPVNPLSLSIARAYRMLKFRTNATNRLQKAGYFVDSLLLVPWFLLGLLVVLVSPRARWRFIPVYIHVATLLVVTFAYFGSIRYRSSYDPILAILTVVFFAWVVGVLRGGRTNGERALFDEEHPRPVGEATSPS